MELFRDAHFVLVPTRGDSYGLVFCEACAFSAPPVGTDTGGVSTIIKDNENGLLIGFDESYESIASRIKSVVLDLSRYVEMSRNARKDFLERLNWRSAGKEIKRIIELCCQRKDV